MPPRPTNQPTQTISMRKLVLPRFVNITFRACCWALGPDGGGNNWRRAPGGGTRPIMALAVINRRTAPGGGTRAIVLRTTSSTIVKILSDSSQALGGNASRIAPGGSYQGDQVFARRDATEHGMTALSVDARSTRTRARMPASRSASAPCRLADKHGGRARLRRAATRGRIYRKLDLDETQVRKLQTDGPESVLGSNACLLGKEKYVAIVGGAGVLVDLPTCG
ncbi:hypothetical protein MBLNU13_g01220t1 [Cladosporium sp. NU13]